MAAPLRARIALTASIFALGSMLASLRDAAAQSSCLSYWGSPIGFGMTSPHGSTVGDWNSDGKPDFAVAYSTGVGVVLGTGVTPLSAASFSAVSSVAVTGTPFAVVAADVNNDAITDLATANYGGTVAVLLGNGSGGVGNGTFSSPLYFPAGTNPFDLVAADFNADGRLDLAVSENACANGGINLLLALAPLVPGQPRFAAPVNRTLGCNAALISSADFNGDHRPDLAIAVNGTGTLQILKGFVGGTFYAPVTVASGLTGIFEARAADVDRDGIVDLISASSSGIQVHWGLGSGGVGDGTFAPGELLLAGSSASVAVGDQDGDGDLDIAFEDGGALQLLRQTSPRVFVTTPDLVAIGTFFGARFADFDRDGRVDLVGGQYSANLVQVMPSRCTLGLPLPVAPVPDPVGPGWEAQGRSVASTGATQSSATAVPDAVGGVYLVWAEASHVHAQHVSAQGERLWGSAGIVVCDIAQTQSLPVAAADGAGGLYVAWLHDPSGGRRARVLRLDSTGVPATGWEPCGVPVGFDQQLSASTSPRIARDGSGGVFVADQVTSGNVKAFHFNAAGVTAAGWPVSGVQVAFKPSGGGTSGTINWNEILSNGTGGLISVHGYSYVTSDPCCSSGSRTAFTNVSSTARLSSGGSIAVPTVALNSLANDWVLATYPGGDGLHAAGLNATGALLWDVILGPSSSGTYPRAVPDGAGGSFVVWDAAGSQGADLFATRLTSTGARAAGWASGATTLHSLPGDQRELQPAYDGAGGFLTVWRDERSGDADIYFDRLDGSGHALPGWPSDGLALVSLPGAQRRPLVVLADPNSAIAVWEDLRNGTSQLYAQRIVLDQPVAALASLQVVSATSTRTTLRWQVTGAPAPVQVQRSARPGEWIVVGEAHPAGESLLEWVDDGVRPADRFGYRLVDTSLGAPISGSETWVTTPNELSLALKGFDPNPAANGASVRFTLPVASPAVLRLFDVTGRQVVSRDVGSLGAGRHQVGLGTLPPGFYVIWLEQSGATRVQRGIVLR